ncbi:MAG: hypothetical protein IKD06_01560 [Clostridia bacterium]|nr:hypothetical protein [Clostridia bacterium]
MQDERQQPCRCPSCPAEDDVPSHPIARGTGLGKLLFYEGGKAMTKLFPKLLSLTLALLMLAGCASTPVTVPSTVPSTVPQTVPVTTPDTVPNTAPDKETIIDCEDCDGFPISNAYESKPLDFSTLPSKIFNVLWIDDERFVFQTSFKEDNGERWPIYLYDVSTETLTLLHNGEHGENYHGFSHINMDFQSNVQVAENGTIGISVATCVILYKDGKTQILQPDVYNDSGAYWTRLSPDFLRVLYYDKDTGIIIEDLQTHEKQVIPNSLGIPMAFWSPDGSYIALENTDYGFVDSIIVHDLQTQEQKEIPVNLDGYTMIQFSADGNYMYISPDYSGFEYGLFTYAEINVEKGTTEIIQQLAKTLTLVSETPAGFVFAFKSDRGQEIALLDRASGNIVQLPGTYKYVDFIWANPSLTQIFVRCRMEVGPTEYLLFEKK